MPNGRLSQAAQQQQQTPPAPQGGGGAVTPQLAQAAAQAGAPAPGGGAPAPGGAPVPGGVRPHPTAQGPAPSTSGPVPTGELRGHRRGPYIPAGVEQVDPGAPAVEGQTPPGMADEKASPDEQAEYERAMRALAAVLYQNDRIANSVVDQIVPDDKINTTTRVSLLLIQQLDEKLQMDESVVAQMSQEVVERITELAEARHQIEYGGRELQVIMGSVWEGVQEMFGMNTHEAEALMVGVGGEDLANLKGQHEAFLMGAEVGAPPPGAGGPPRG